MEPPSYMRSVVDRNVVMRPIPVFPWCIFIPCLLCLYLRSASTSCAPVCSNFKRLFRFRSQSNIRQAKRMIWSLIWV